MQDIVPVKYIDDKLYILDQTLLPGEERFIELTTKEDVWDAIYKLKVRGAPAIGVAAAYGIYIATRSIETASLADFASRFGDVKNYLNSARPTAVNLSWALNRMEKKLEALIAETAEAETGPATESSEPAGAAETAECRGDGAVSAREGALKRIKAGLLQEAETIRKEDEASCKAMGEYGLTLLRPKMGILTHCNAGTIATAKYGTCLAPIHLGQERGYDFKVFADETRPLLQGARLTAWELQKSGVDVTLICDNMAATVMKNGWVDAVVVGCDRMAANGDGANKIGTMGVAILAKEFGIPFYMYVPTSTIDLATKTGADIKIELRDGEEIYRMWYEKPMAPEGIKTYNPSFDVTPASYITAVVTEKGIVYPPYEKNLKALFDLRDTETI